MFTPGWDCDDAAAAVLWLSLPSLPLGTYSLGWVKVVMACFAFLVGFTEGGSGLYTQREWPCVGTLAETRGEEVGVGRCGDG